MVDRIQCILSEATGRSVEVMIYGDGAFKDPVGESGNWPTRWYRRLTRPGWRARRIELKLKYLADNDFAGLSPDRQGQGDQSYILKKGRGSDRANGRPGHHPRRLADLLGSLCDLTSGSGDKGTPFTLPFQGYFDNYAN